MKGLIFDIKELSLHDGPGPRVTVFFKGCPLRCLWCHNPEGFLPRPELLITKNGCTECGLCRKPCSHPECEGLGRCLKMCPKGLLRVAGEWAEAQVLASRLSRYAPMLPGGGVTISGGEPLMQPEFLLELLQLLKHKNMHTVVETSGYADEATFIAVMEACDMVYLDIKHTDDLTHRKLTGVSNVKILQNLRQLVTADKPFIVRATLIPGLNDDKDNLIRLAELLAEAKHLTGVEFLTYNPFTEAKYRQLGILYPLAGKVEELKNYGILEQVFGDMDIPCRIL